MAHPDANKSFEEMFYDCMWGVLSEAGISFNATKLEKFQDACKRSAGKLEIKVRQTVIDECKKLREVTKEGFKRVAEDMDKSDKRIKDTWKIVSELCIDVGDLENHTNK